MKHLLFFVALFLLFSFGKARAQKQGNNRVDSLLKQLPIAKEDTGKAMILNDLSSGYCSRNADLGIKYGQQALDLAEKLGWKKGIAVSYNCLGNNYRAKSDYLKALDYYFKALKVNEESGYKKGIAQNFGNIGMVYFEQSNSPKALDYMFKALKISEEIGNKNSAAINLGNIATIYYQGKDYSRALEYMQKSLSIHEQTGYKLGTATLLGNIGNVYSSQKNISKALEYALRSLQILEELGDKSGIARTEGNIGNYYANQNNLPKALAYTYKALIISEELGEKSTIAQHLGEAGWYYMGIAGDTTGTIKHDSLIPIGKKANLHKAIDYLTRSIQLCKEIGDLYDLQRFLTVLSDAQAMSGNYKGALESHKQFVIAKDSVFNAENNIKITNLETQRGIDLKDRDIEIKNKQIEVERLAVAKKRNERGFFIAGIIILIIVAFILFRNYEKLSEHRNALEKLRAVSDERIRIASEMHDELGSGLTSIRMLSEIAAGKIGHSITAKSEIEKIEKSATNLSENLREIIWTMNTRFDKLDDFIIYVRSYAVEFFDESPVHFQFNAPDIIPEITLNGELRRNLFLCIKEALNNIMKHSRANDASLSIELHELTILIIAIKDNGIGINASQMNKFGNGLTTMKERLKKFGDSLEIEVNDGTALRFKIAITQYK